VYQHSQQVLQIPREERSLIAYVRVSIAQSNHYMYKPYLQTP